jgi:hypothetical protein
VREVRTVRLGVAVCVGVGVALAPLVGVAWLVGEITAVAVPVASGGVGVGLGGDGSASAAASTSAAEIRPSPFWSASAQAPSEGKMALTTAATRAARVPSPHAAPAWLRAGAATVSQSASNALPNGRAGLIQPSARLRRVRMSRTAACYVVRCSVCARAGSGSTSRPRLTVG